MALPEMELNWLEDFNALAEHGSFIRAAQARHVTQPAFSRRIRALEQWMGVALFVRTPQGTTLTEAGQHIQASVIDAAGRLYRLRSEAQEVAQRATAALQFAATHSLSFTFFPRWIRQQEQSAALHAVQLHSDSMANCEQLLLRGTAQFLLSHRDPAVDSPLEADHFESLTVGQDRLIPLVGRELGLGAASSFFPYLAYTDASGLGRILRHRLGQRQPATLSSQAHFSSHLAAVLMSMAIENKGLAWLPESLSEQEVAEGRLVRALPPEWDVPVAIQLTRPRQLASPFASAFWQTLVATQRGQKVTTR